MKLAGPTGSWLCIAALLALASWSPAASDAQIVDSDWVHYRHLSVATAFGIRRVLVTYPRRVDRRPHPPGERYPIVIALHGRTEALQGPNRGYRAWATTYGLTTSFAALQRGRLSRRDYRGHVRASHLEYVNATLRSAHFRGLAVVTPYVPDIGGQAVGSERMAEYADWLAGPLLAAVRERFPGLAQTREGTGIDGVSLGGRVALEVGFRHPDVFGVVGGMQPAIREQEEALADLALRAAQRHPQRIRLLSSDDDPFLWATRRLSNSLRERRLPHTLSVVAGPHSNDFNRGPGGLEMLLYHARALTREPVEDQ